MLRYLSAAPEGVEAALITGGIPSLTRPAEDVYRATYPRVESKNRAFFERYPHAQGLTREIADYLLANDVRLPNGQPFTVRQFQQLGLSLGSSTGSEALIDLLENAFVTVDGRREVAYEFLHRILSATSFNLRPIFTILHEAIYAQEEATRWAAERVRSEFPQFNYAPGKEFLFTGEMVYPWMLDEFSALQPLKEAANILAEKSDWPHLYDLDQLESNQVPAAAALYYDDMYVDLNLAMESVERIPNLNVWVTNEYEHDGLRMDGERILDRLLELLPVKPEG